MDIAPGNTQEKDLHSHKFLLRFPFAMRTIIKNLARTNRRSMNSEIVIRIERSLRGEHSAEHRPSTSLEVLSVSDLKVINQFRLLSTQKREALLQFLEKR
jgi:hypothetical protein